jgi:hypothetical protein
MTSVVLVNVGYLLWNVSLISAMSIASLIKKICGQWSSTLLWHTLATVFWLQPVNNPTSPKIACQSQQPHWQCFEKSKQYYGQSYYSWKSNYLKWKYFKGQKIYKQSKNRPLITTSSSVVFLRVKNNKKIAY